jgi:methylthioribulose-1-phosphate dehydratase
MKSLDDLPPRAALVEVARDFHRRGWMAATAGNLSVREDAEHFWITASGRAKGRLEERDFLLVAIASGEVVDAAYPGNRPSAEAVIHRTVYRLFPTARACLHVHTVDACLVGEAAPAGSVALPLAPIEMLKAFDIWEERPQVGLPLFANHLQVAAIAAEIDERFRTQPPAVSALLIRGHGATVWGEGLQQAYNRLEALEFILAYMSRRQSAR